MLATSYGSHAPLSADFACNRVNRDHSLTRQHRILASALERYVTAPDRKQDAPLEMAVLETTRRNVLALPYAGSTGRISISAGAQSRSRTSSMPPPLIETRLYSNFCFPEIGAMESVSSGEDVI